MSSSPTERAPGLSREESWPDEVTRIRWRIDAVNLQLLRLLEHRAQLALEVARLKQRRGLPLHDAPRELDMLAELACQSRGLLELCEVEGLFRGIFDMSRAFAQRRTSRADP